MLYQDLLQSFFTWLNANWFPILSIIIVFVIGYIIYVLIKKQINFLVKKHKLEKATANTLKRIIRIIIILIILTAVIVQFSESLGLIPALFTLAGGTIIGFAAMNTIGNTIAGLIVMISKPFTAGDRIYHNGKLVDIVEIKLIYTKMEDLDGIEIHVPNQQLLSDEIINLRKNGNIVRRSVKVTPGFDEDRTKVEKALLDAAKKVKYVLKSPEPYVWITNFQNYAVEYSLFVFINDITHLPIIDSELYKSVLDTCKDYNIDISTPLLLRNVGKS